MALTFTPDNRALNGMPGCGLCGVYAQVLSPVTENGVQLSIEVDPGVWYDQMANDYDAALAEINQHMTDAHPTPDEPSLARAAARPAPRARR